ncbi:RloB family protein [Bacteroidota bacterium]
MRRNKNIPFKTKPKYAIVVDGDCEFWYIQMLKRNERLVDVNLEPKIPQRKKLSEQYELVVELSNIYDKVFWVIDFDVINSETRSGTKGKQTALQEFKGYYENIEKNYTDIHIIINNPCLEFWILLHFETTSRYFENCDKVVRQLKTHKFISDYKKSQRYYTKQGNDIYLKLKPYLKQAIANSNKLAGFNFQNPHSGLSQMQLFFESDNLKRLIE